MSPKFSYTPSRDIFFKRRRKKIQIRTQDPVYQYELSTWVFEYVLDSGSYYKSYFLTMHGDSAFDCYELQVAALARLPRSAATLLFPLAAPCCTPPF